METLSVSLALCERNPSVSGGCPSKGSVMHSFVFYQPKWAVEDADLRRHNSHVTPLYWWVFLNADSALDCDIFNGMYSLIFAFLSRRNLWEYNLEQVWII